jgi:reactive intermediate/imine deaminase
MAEKHMVSTDDAPAAVGAYSQATTTGDLVFTAGQIALTPAGDLLDDEPVEVQTEQALDNAAAILEAAGSGLDAALKVTVFLDDIDDYEAMNEAYGAYFDDEPPARSAVAVADLPAGAAVEIETVGAVE